MAENKLLLSEFVSDQGFELNRYLIHLFDYFSKRSIVEKEHTKSAP